MYSNLFNNKEDIKMSVNNIFELNINIIQSSPIEAIIQGVGSANAAAQPDMQTPCAALQAKIAAGTPAPPVETPATPPAPLTQATHSALHPV
jgi:hypothetical protein